MRNVLVRFIDMPCSVRGCVVRHYDGDEFYTVMLNSRLSSDMQERVYLHEIEHISNDDFTSGLSADEIESIRHK